ncbi:MAG: methyltransferase domain-containing protein [Bacteroidales bacterium]|nr:methyltransferase domain-containing protein [Bacteroidales bacterium]
MNPKIELYHPRVFSDEKWAEGYYRRNAKNIIRTGRRLSGILARRGFRGCRILDAGCGFAAVAIELARAFPQAEIVGVDLAEPLLDTGRSLISKAGMTERIHIGQGDVHHLDFPDHDFDLTVSSYMLHIVEDPVQMLNELERVTKSDGIIMITDLRRIWLAFLAGKLRTVFTAEEALQVIESSSIRKGNMSRGPFWWDYIAGLPVR